MAQVLVFQQVPWEGPGLIGSVLEQSGIGVTILHPADTDRAESVYEASDALVLMGGPMSVNDPLPWLDTEVRLIRRALAEGKPVLGVCLGAQVLAKALGSRVYPNHTKEIGWGDIELTPFASADSLFTGLPKIFPVLHWHGETFDLPPETVHLASSGLCRNQAFRAGNSAWGFQFHIEITADMLRNWLAQPEMCAGLPGHAAPIEVSSRSEETGRLLFSRWAQLIR